MTESMLDEKQEQAIHVKRSIEGLTNDLTRELSKGGSLQPVRVCEFSRALSDEADHVFSHPEVWSDEMIETAHDLLEQSATATIGSEYHANCSRRPAEFKRRIRTAREARSALAAIDC